jgi:Mrp family chromosome partitioning ATPase/capsular polysaccharide biosynthesis protein
MTERIETGDFERRAPRRAAAEEPIEVRRHLDALRRSLPLVAGIVVVLAVATYVVSTSLPKRYKATTSIVQRTNATLDTSNSVDTIARDLNTINSLVTTDDVLNGAARKLGGETLHTLRDKVSSSVDPNANLIYVTAKDASAQQSARIANAVANTFVSEQADIERRQYEHALADLQDELANITGQGATTADQEQAIRDRISQLRVSIATAGSDLGIAQRADPPETQDTPRPLRNTALAIVLGLFLGVLVALGRDQLVPRVSGSRELSRLLELPVLVSVPYVSTRRGRRSRALTGIEYETYQTLATSVRFTLTPADGPHVVLVTSALHAEGKSTVTLRLGRALAHAGHRTLLISADMRWPTLHDLAGVPLGPGLADLLQEELPGRSAETARSLVGDRIEHAPGRRRGVLDVLPSGRKPQDPTELLADVALDVVFDAIADLDYTYVLVDAPPLLGIADTQALARRATSILYVARLDRITLENVVDARDILDRIDRPSAGMVVIGARSEASPYYLSSRAVPALEDV